MTEQGKSARAAWNRWLHAEQVDADTKEELSAMDRKTLQDSFSGLLAFGTGGLRGLLGAGTCRMNLYTVGQATQALAQWLRKNDAHPAAAIAYDSRTGSALFARRAASVLAANGIKACLYPRLEPTAALSFAVRDLHCGAGICITASHNPAQYNGYKVYGADGCQITLAAAAEIAAEMETVDPLGGVKADDFGEALSTGRICWIGEDTLDRFLAAVRAQAMPLPETEETPLRVVYTPLNGTGLECILRILHAAGVEDVHVVEEQKDPDGRFPTCPYPNPEIMEALRLGLRDCETFRPDVLLATDPDCDRVGIAVPKGDTYVLLTGNEVGVLLLNFICRIRRETGTMPERPVAVTTIVSTAMAEAVAKDWNVEIRRTLTGFKFIGEQIGLLEKAEEAERYIFGFEESYGYLSGTHVRDKDAVNASMLICQMARWYKRRGTTLFQAMQELYRRYGFYRETLHGFDFETAAGRDAVRAFCASLREHPPKEWGGLSVTGTTDYLAGTENLPKADVLSFTLEGDCKIMIRPSGTEHKLKVYLSARGKDRETAEHLERRIYAALADRLRA